MSLSAASAALGIPEPIVARSAAARAQATGVSADDILAAWAGGSAAPAGAAPAPAPAAAATPDAPEVPAAATPAVAPPAPTATPPTAAPTIAAAAPAAVAARPPAPETVSPDEALDWEQVTTIRTIGLKERTRVRVPGWLLAVFVLVPVISVFYIGLNAEGAACGDGGQMGVDWAGNLTNCDGSAFEPGGGGGGAELAAVFAAGQEFYAQCAGCHGPTGGGASGPAFTGGAVLATWSQCADHIEWVNLGSEGWRSAHGGTYGDPGHTVNGGMPGYAAVDPETVTAVVLYERVAFGGQPLADAGVDCGLVGGEGEEGGEEGEAPADGEEAPAEDEEASEEA